MDAEREGLAVTIGARVRALRQALGWTLDDAAERSGVSRRMIVKVEKGETNPSVGTLLRLGDALGASLPTLVARDDAAPAAVTPRGEGTILWASPAGGEGVLLSGSSTPAVLALWSWRLMPGDTHASNAHPAGTREILHVTSGAITLSISSDPMELSEGDTFSFGGDQPHSYANAGHEPATFTLVVSQP
jgi:transcriptional regulator with XRE-family HTH domain